MNSNYAINIRTNLRNINALSAGMQKLNEAVGIMAKIRAEGQKTTQEIGRSMNQEMSGITNKLKDLERQIESLQSKAGRGGGGGADPRTPRQYAVNNMGLYIPKGRRSEGVRRYTGMSEADYRYHTSRDQRDVEMRFPRPLRVPASQGGGTLYTQHMLLQMTLQRFVTRPLRDQLVAIRDAITKIKITTTESDAPRRVKATQQKIDPLERLQKTYGARSSNTPRGPPISDSEAESLVADAIKKMGGKGTFKRIMPDNLLSGALSSMAAASLKRGKGGKAAEHETADTRRSLKSIDDTITGVIRALEEQGREQGVPEMQLRQGVDALEKEMKQRGKVALDAYASTAGVYVSKKKKSGNWEDFFGDLMAAVLESKVDPKGMAKAEKVMNTKSAMDMDQQEMSKAVEQFRSKLFSRYFKDMVRGKVSAIHGNANAQNGVLPAKQWLEKNLETVGADFVKQFGEKMGTKPMRMLKKNFLSAVSTFESDTEVIDLYNKAIAKLRKNAKKMGPEGKASIDPALVGALNQPIAVGSGNTPADWAAYSAEKERNKTIHSAIRRMMRPTEMSPADHMKFIMRRMIGYGVAGGALYGVGHQATQGLGTMANYETQMVGLRRNMGPINYSPSEITNRVSGLASQYGGNLIDTTKAMKVFASDSRNINEIMKQTQTALMATNVTEMDLEKSTQSLIATEKMFGISGTNSIRILDAWTAVTKNTSVSADTLADATRSAGQMARTAGIDFDTFNGIVATVGERTRKSGTIIGQTLKYVFEHIRDIKAVSAMQSVGVLSVDPNGNFRSGKEVLGELAQKWRDLTDAQKQNLGVAVAGTYNMQDFLILMNNWDRVIDTSVASMTSQGSAMRYNREIMGTLNKQVDQLKASYDALWAQLGQTGALTTLKQMVDVVSQLLSGVTALNRATHGTFSGAIGLGAAGLAAAGAVGYGSTLLPGMVGFARPSSQAGLVDGQLSQLAAGARPGAATISAAEAAILARAQGGGPAGSPSMDPARTMGGGLTPGFFNRGRTTGVGMMVAASLIRGSYDNMGLRSDPNEAPSMRDTAVDMGTSGLGGFGLIKAIQGGNKFSQMGKMGKAGVAIVAVATIIEMIKSASTYIQKNKGDEKQETEVNRLNNMLEKYAQGGSRVAELTATLSGAGPKDLAKMQEAQGLMGAMAPGSDNYKDGVATQARELRGLRTDAIRMQLNANMGSKEVKAAAEKRATAVEEFNKNAMKWTPEQRFKNLAVRQEAEGTLNESLLRVMQGEALSSGQAGLGFKGMDQDRLYEMSKMTGHSVQDLGRDYMGNVLRGAGAGDVNVDKMLTKNGRPDVFDAIKNDYVQLQKNGPILRLIDMTEVARGKNEIAKTIKEIKAQGGNVFDISGDKFKNGMVVSSHEQISKLVGQYAQALDHLAQKNDELIKSIQFVSQTMEEAGFVQAGQPGGANVAMQNAARMFDGMKQIQNGASGFGSPTNGLSGNPLGQNITQLIGEASRMIAENKTMSIRGLVEAAHLGQSTPNMAVRQVNDWVDVLVKNHGKSNDDAVGMDFENTEGPRPSAANNYLKAALGDDKANAIIAEISQISQYDKSTDPKEQQLYREGIARAKGMATAEVKSQLSNLQTKPVEELQKNLSFMKQSAMGGVTALGFKYREGVDLTGNRNIGEFAAGKESTAFRSNVEGLRTAVQDGVDRQKQIMEDVAKDPKLGLQSTEYDNASKRFKELTSTVDLLDSLLKNWGTRIEMTSQGLNDMARASGMMEHLSTLGGTAGLTGVNQNQYAVDKLQESIDNLKSKENGGNNAAIAVEIARLRQALTNQQDAIARELETRNALQKNLSSSVMASNIATAMGLTGGQAGGRAYAESQIQAFHELSGRIAKALPTEGKSATQMQQQALAVAKIMAPITGKMRDMQLSLNTGYQKNYMLAGPSQRAMADAVRSMIQQGMTASQIFSDPYTRSAAKDNPLLQDLMGMSLEQDVNVRAVEYQSQTAENTASMARTMSALATYITGVGGNANALNAPQGDTPNVPGGLATGSMSKAGTAAVDSKGRIRTDGTLAQLHAGEIVLNKGQSEALLKNKYASGTLPRSFEAMLDYNSKSRVFTYQPTAEEMAAFKSAGISYSSITGKKLINFLREARNKAQGSGAFGLNSGEMKSLMESGALSGGRGRVAGSNAYFQPFQTLVDPLTGKLHSARGMTTTISAVMGTNPGQHMQSAIALLTHEKTHQLDMPFGDPEAWGAKLSLEQKARLEQLNRIELQRMLSEKGSAMEAVRGRIGSGYSNYLPRTGQSMNSYFRSSDPRSLATELNAARREIILGGKMKLGGVDAALDRIKFQTGVSLHTGLAKGLSPTEMGGIIDAAVREQLNVLKSGGHTIGLNDLSAKILKSGVPSRAMVEQAAKAAATSKVGEVTTRIPTTSLNPVYRDRLALGISPKYSGDGSPMSRTANVRGSLSFEEWLNNKLDPTNMADRLVGAAGAPFRAARRLGSKMLSPFNTLGTMPIPNMSNMYTPKTFSEKFGRIFQHGFNLPTYAGYGMDKLGPGLKKMFGDSPSYLVPYDEAIHGGPLTFEERMNERLAKVFEPERWGLGSKLKSMGSTVRNAPEAAAAQYIKMTGRFGKMRTIDDSMIGLTNNYAAGQYKLGLGSMKPSQMAKGMARMSNRLERWGLSMNLKGLAGKGGQAAVYAMMADMGGHLFDKMFNTNMYSKTGGKFYNDYLSKPVGLAGDFMLANQLMKGEALLPKTIPVLSRIPGIGGAISRLSAFSNTSAWGGGMLGKAGRFAGNAYGRALWYKAVADSELYAVDAAGLALNKSGLISDGSYKGLKVNTGDLRESSTDVVALPFKAIHAAFDSRSWNAGKAARGAVKGETYAGAQGSGMGGLSSGYYANIGWATNRSRAHEFEQQMQLDAILPHFDVATANEVLDAPIAFFGQQPEKPKGGGVSRDPQGPRYTTSVALREAMQGQSDAERVLAAYNETLSHFPTLTQDQVDTRTQMEGQIEQIKGRVGTLQDLVKKAGQRVASGNGKTMTTDDLFEYTQSMKPEDLQRLMSTGATKAISLLQKMGGKDVKDIQTGGWSDLALALPPTAKVIDLINAANGKKYTSGHSLTGGMSDVAAEDSFNRNGGSAIERRLSYYKTAVNVGERQLKDMTTIAAGRYTNSSDLVNTPAFLNALKLVQGTGSGPMLTRHTGGPVARDIDPRRLGASETIIRDGEYVMPNRMVSSFKQGVKELQNVTNAKYAFDSMGIDAGSFMNAGESGGSSSVSHSHEGAVQFQLGDGVHDVISQLVNALHTSSERQVKGQRIKRWYERG